MSIHKLALALAALRKSQQMEKTAGFLGGVGDVLHQVEQGAKDTGRKITESGHPLAGFVVGQAPNIAKLYAAKKIYESEPVQNMMNRYKLWKYQREMRRAQQQQGY